MAFRADEAAQDLFEKAKEQFIPKGLKGEDRLKSENALIAMRYELGSVIQSYPSWHPLVARENSENDITCPDTETGYLGLDHTLYFVNGFLTCPYGDGQSVLDSVEALPKSDVAKITAERLSVPLYNETATPILVTCKWNFKLLADKTIPLKLAMPLILEKELKHWKKAQVAETWETMRPYFLGKPHGSRSSLFIKQEAGSAIKKIWNSLIDTGMYGPIYR